MTSDGPDFLASKLPWQLLLHAHTCLHLPLSRACFSPAPLPLFYGTCAFVLYKTSPVRLCAVQDSGCKSLGVKSIRQHRVYGQPYRPLHILIAAKILFATPAKKAKSECETSSQASSCPLPCEAGRMNPPGWAPTGRAGQCWAERGFGRKEVIKHSPKFRSVLQVSN